MNTNQILVQVLLLTVPLLALAWMVRELRKPSATSPRPSTPEAEREKIAVELFNPRWGEQKRLWLERLANTPPGDPLMLGLLALLEQSVLVQIQRCEDPKVGEAEARAIVNSIGLLVGLRTDIEEAWKTQLSKKAQAEAKQG